MAAKACPLLSDSEQLEGRGGACQAFAGGTLGQPHSDPASALTSYAASLEWAPESWCLIILRI